jgi:hypothetical protein
MIMGYSTTFTGHLDLSTPLNDHQQKFLDYFVNCRQCIYKQLHDNHPIFEMIKNCNLPMKKEYLVSDNDHDVKLFNDHTGKPSLNCDWIVEDNQLKWNENEKFYNYLEWLQYLIDNFFNVWNIKLNGIMDYKGEDLGDCGTIVVNDSIITITTQNIDCQKSSLLFKKKFDYDKTRINKFFNIISNHMNNSIENTNLKELSNMHLALFKNKVVNNLNADSDINTLFDDFCYSDKTLMQDTKFGIFCFCIRYLFIIPLMKNDY